MNARYDTLLATGRRKITRDAGGTVYLVLHRRIRLLLRHRRRTQRAKTVRRAVPRPGRPGPRRRGHRHPGHPAALPPDHRPVPAGPVLLPAGLPLHHRLQFRHRPRPRMGRGRLHRRRHRPPRPRRRLAARRNRRPTADQDRLPHRHRHRRPGRLRRPPARPPDGRMTAATAAVPSAPAPYRFGAGRNHYGHLGRLHPKHQPGPAHRPLHPPDPAARPHRRHRPGHRRTTPGLRHRHRRTRRGAARPLRQPPRDRLPALLHGLQARRPPARPRRAHRRQRRPRDRSPATRACSPPSPPPRFGPVHARRMRGKTVLPCRPRRDHKVRRCPHGRDISCPVRHGEHDPRLGRALCPDCYDYQAAVLFNAHAGRPVAPVHHLPAPPPGPPHRAHPKTAPRPGPGPLRQSRRVPGQGSGPLPRRDPPRRPRRRLPATTGPVHHRPAVRRHRPGRRCGRRHGRPGQPTRPGPRSPCGSAPRSIPSRSSAVTTCPAPGQAVGPGGRQLHRQVRHQSPRRPRPARPAAAVLPRHRRPALPPPLPGR